MENGLPDTTLTAMVQNQKGYLWFGTFEGLVRFDGMHFVRLHTSNTPQLPSDSVVNVHLDRAGRMWISTDKGLVIRDARKWHAPEGWKGNDVVRTFSERANGDLLLTTFNGLLLQASEGRIRELPLPPGVPGEGYHGYADENGNWWAIRSDFIGRFNGSHWIATPELGSGATGCCTARDGGMWLLSLDKNTLCKVRHSQLERQVTLSEPPGDFWSMSEDREGHLWIATTQSGVCRVSSDGTLTRWTTRNGLAADATRFVFEDAEANLWVGTSGGGMQRFKQRRFQHVAAGDGPSDRVVHSVCPTADGSLLIGTYGGGLTRWRDGNAQRIHFADSVAAAAYVQSVLSDRAGRIWVGTFRGGLWLSEGGRFRQIPCEQTGGSNVVGLFEDSGGRIWINGGDTIAVCEAGEFRSFAGVPEAPTHLVRFAEAADGAVWAAGENGVFCYRDGRFSEWKDNGATIRNVNAMLGDRAGAVWIAQNHGDLLCCRSGSTAHINATAGLPAGEVRALVEGDLGYLWMTTNRGIYRVNRDDLLAYAARGRGALIVNWFNAEDGLPSLDFPRGTQPNCGRDNNGCLWFATSNGVATIDPRTVRINTIPATVDVQTLVYHRPSSRSGRLVPPPGQSLPEEVRLPGPFAGSQHLPAGTRWVEIDYAGLSLGAPSKVRYEVKLEPLDSDWQSVGNQRVVYYRDLLPDHYVFHVRAANGDGIWNVAGTALDFTVEPYFWQTAWFRGAVGLGLVGLGAAVAWWISRRRHRRELARQQQRNELAHLSRVAMLGELSGSLAHELNQPLSAILTNAQAAQRFLQQDNVDRAELRDILCDIVADNRRADEIIRRVRLMLKKGEVQRLPIDLNETVHDVLSLARSDLQKHDITVETELEPGLPLVCGDRVQLQQVLLNLLMNASEAMTENVNGDRRITVRTRRLGDGSVQTSVIDQGCGISRDRPQRIFDSFVTTKPHGLGLGLAICRTIVTSHGGILSAVNNDDRGATFRMTFPGAGGVK